MDEHLAERLSAAVDGELSGKERQHLVDALCQDPALRARWTRYHCLGDVLRKEATCVDGHLLAARVRQELEGEAVVTVPAGWWTGRRRQWIPLGGAVAASMTFLALIGMPSLDGRDDSAAVAVISQAPADAAESHPPSPAPRTVTARIDSSATPVTTGLSDQAASPRLSRYLIDHSHFSSASVQGIPSTVRIAAQPEP